MKPIDLTILSIETLAAIKRDSAEMIRSDVLYSVRLEAHENIQKVDEELDRRIAWSKAVQYALAQEDES